MRTTIIAAIISAAIASIASFTVASATSRPQAHASADPVVAQLQAINRNITGMRQWNRSAVALLHNDLDEINTTLGSYGPAGSKNVLVGLYDICNLLTSQASVYCQ